ncbi:hypothetical protein RDWZM_006736 [Blomia tropicalis]|uniref:E3 ubiquitin-protein ligase CHIP n=1 Tax=Blomia tropicalis TaxID=40697 RepID=A0A9Q0M8T5_BLOTA|nr:hypothetical protein RDWZM_006736 [Blomia tropicalis]
MKHEMNAFELKDEGNKYFTLHKYEEAIAYYTKAITRNSSIATFYTNRALCYLKQKNWEASCADSRRALELDSNLIKGHFFLGQALLEMDHYDDSIFHLQRALELSKESKSNYGDEIAYQMRLARKKRWNVLEEKRIHEEIELQRYLNTLIQADKEKQLDKLHDDIKNNVITDESIVQNLEHVINTTCGERLIAVNDLFAQIDDKRKNREVPDFLCGKISFEIMQDPVITPSGITYDRKDIDEHLQRVGHFDPITRTPLTSSQLIPNLAMKEVIDNFLLENEWANDY